MQSVDDLTKKCVIAKITPDEIEFMNKMINDDQVKEIINRGDSFVKYEEMPLNTQFLMYTLMSRFKNAVELSLIHISEPTRPY